MGRQLAAVPQARGLLEPFLKGPWVLHKELSLQHRPCLLSVSVFKMEGPWFSREVTSQGNSP